MEKTLVRQVPSNWGWSGGAGGDAIASNATSIRPSTPHQNFIGSCRLYLCIRAYGLQRWQSIRAPTLAEPTGSNAGRDYGLQRSLQSLRAPTLASGRVRSMSTALPTTSVSMPRRSPPSNGGRLKLVLAAQALVLRRRSPAGCSLPLSSGCGRYHNPRREGLVVSLRSGRFGLVVSDHLSLPPIGLPPKPAPTGSRLNR